MQVVDTKPGTRVHVRDVTQSEIGWGTFISSDMLSQGIPSVAILLDGGSIIFGFESFWCDDMPELEPPKRIDIELGAPTQAYSAVDGSALPLEQLVSPGLLQGVPVALMLDGNPELFLDCSIAREKCYILVRSSELPMWSEKKS